MGVSVIGVSLHKQGMRILLGALIGFTLWATPPYALEMSANSNNHAFVGQEIKSMSMYYLIKAAIDELTRRIVVCGQKSKSYAPTLTGADADGCK